jgi:Tol biopolymer transport system component
MNERMEERTIDTVLRARVPQRAPADLIATIVTAAQGTPQLRRGITSWPWLAPMPAAVRTVVLLALTGLLVAVAIGVATIGSSPGPLVMEVRNGPIAFVGDDGDVHVVNPDGSAHRILVQSPTAEWHPAWSPDGAWIAFVRQVAEGGRDPSCETPPEDPDAVVEWAQRCEEGLPSTSQIFLIRPDGTGERQLTEAVPGTLWGVSWSPNGDTIAYAHLRLGGVFVVDVATGETRQVFSDPAPDIGGWSPDGRLLLVHGGVVGNVEDRGVFAVAADGSGARRIAAELTGVSWSPDGTRIAGWRDLTGRGEVTAIVTIAADGTGERVLNDDGVWPRWSPDGRSIAYTRVNGRADGTLGEAWLMDADGSNQRKLADGDVDGWSPDGEWILFSPRGGGTALIRPDGTGRATIADDSLSFTNGWDWLAVRP